LIQVGFVPLFFLHSQLSYINCKMQLHIQFDLKSLRK